MELNGLISELDTDNSYDFTLSLKYYYHLSEDNKLLLEDSNTDVDKYFLDTKKLYKIWFNTNPDIFLSEENKLRLEKMRIDNPDAELSLLYSSRLLSSSTEQGTKEFLAKYNINAVDFDKIVKELSNASFIPENELKILYLASKELDDLSGRDNAGGNPAAAADILRFSIAISGKLGVYSDFDVHLNFGNYEKCIPIFSPIVIPTNNNDFVGFAKEYDSQYIHPRALNEISKIQNAIIGQYNFYDSTNSEFSLYRLDQRDRILFEKAQKEEKEFSIMEYRSQIRKMDMYDVIELVFRTESYVDRGFSKEKISQNRELIDSFRLLDSTGIEKLFCDVYGEDVFMGNSRYIQKESLCLFFELIRKNMDRDETKTRNFQRDLYFEFLSTEDLKLLSLEDLMWMLGEFRNAHELYNLDKLSNHYCSLASMVYLMQAKSILYLRSVISISGPQILDRLYRREDRYVFSPAYNNINGIIRTDRQDGSWYLGYLS